MRAWIVAGVLSLGIAACATAQRDVAPLTGVETPAAPRLSKLGALMREYDGLAANAAANAARLSAIASEASVSATAERDRETTAAWRALSARAHWAAGEDAATEAEAGLGWVVCRDLIPAGSLSQDTARDCAFLASIGPLARAKRAADATPALSGDPSSSDLTLAQWQALRDGVGRYERAVSDGWTQSAADLASVPHAPAEVKDFDQAAKKKLWCAFAAKTSTAPLWRSAAEDANAKLKTETVNSYYDSAAAVAAAVALAKPQACESDAASLQCKRATEAALNAGCR